MSTHITQIETLRGKLDLTQFAGPVEPMLQLTQSSECYIQLTYADVITLIPHLVNWIQADCDRRVKLLKSKIAGDVKLERTIFAEAVKCGQFVETLEVPLFEAAWIGKLTTPTPQPFSPPREDT